MTLGSWLYSQARPIRELRDLSDLELQAKHILQFEYILLQSHLTKVQGHYCQTNYLQDILKTFNFWCKLEITHEFDLNFLKKERIKDTNSLLSFGQIRNYPFKP